MGWGEEMFIRGEVIALGKGGGGRWWKYEGGGLGEGGLGEGVGISRKKVICENGR